MPQRPRERVGRRSGNGQRSGRNVRRERPAARRGLDARNRDSLGERAERRAPALGPGGELRQGDPQLPERRNRVVIGAGVRRDHGLERGERELVDAHGARERILAEPFDGREGTDHGAPLRATEELVEAEADEVRARLEAAPNRGLAIERTTEQVRGAGHDEAAAQVFEKRELVLVREARHVRERRSFGEPDHFEVRGVNAQDARGALGDGAVVIFDPCAIGRADFDEPRARAREDLRNSEAAADFDELAAGDQNVPARRNGREREEHRRGVVVHEERRLARHERRQGGLRGSAAAAPLSGLHIELERGITAENDGYVGERRRGKRCAAEIRVQDDPRRVHDPPLLRPLSPERFPPNRGDDLVRLRRGSAIFHLFAKSGDHFTSHGDERRAADARTARRELRIVDQTIDLRQLRELHDDESTVPEPPMVGDAVMRPVLACAALLLFAATAAAEPEKKTTSFDIPFEKYSLPNGLEVILHHDASLPLVAVNLWYHVGPSNEPAHRSGFAHLFEHLMFEGSKHVGHEFDHLLESVGATNVNGTTSWDRTNYFETVPAHELELALWLESDRMGFLLDTLTNERLDVQRDVVKNERRQRYDNSPYGPSELKMYETLFPPDHPYHGAVIGSMEDLSRASMDDVRSFFRAFYAPSNATLALAGDFDPKSAKALVERYFGSLPTVARPASAAGTTPPLKGSVEEVVEEPVKLARVSFGWLTPPAYTPDDTTLDVVSVLLAGGKATRLYQELVVKTKLASDVSSELDSNKLASMFDVQATVAAGIDPKRVKEAVDGVIAKLGTEGPTPAELDRAKRRIRLHILSDLQRLDGEGGESGRAGTLQRFNHYLGDPGKLGEYVARVDAVTSEAVKKAVQTFLPSNARVIVTTRPNEAAGEKEGGE